LVVTSVSNAANRSGALSVALEVNIIHELSMEPTDFDPSEIDITYGERSTYDVMIHNTGNIRSEYRIFTSEDLRGWSVVLDGPNEDCSLENGDLLCWIEAGESIPIEVSIRPPYQSEIDDIYKFTLSAEPVELEEIGRENIEFKVSGTSADNLLGLDDRTTLSIVGSVFVLVLIGSLLLRRRQT